MWDKILPKCLFVIDTKFQGIAPHQNQFVDFSHLVCDKKTPAQKTTLMCDNCRALKKTAGYKTIGRNHSHTNRIKMN